ncbi:hypothetical protein AOLI_G00096720 [Acnodon oligacanthus]
MKLQSLSMNRCPQRMRRGLCLGILKILTFFKMTAEELVRQLEYTFHVRVPKPFFYEFLVDQDNQLHHKHHPDCIWWLHHGLVKQQEPPQTLTPLRKGHRGSLRCKTSAPPPSVNSEFEELNHELGGSIDATDLSDDECSEIFIGFQTYGYSLVCMKGAESPLEGWPDSLSSIPAVQVTEASEDSEVKNNEDLVVPACSDGITDSITSRAKKKWKKLSTRINSITFCVLKHF